MMFNVKRYKMEMRLLTPVIINSGEYFEFGEICRYKGKKPNDFKYAQLNLPSVIGKMDDNMKFVIEAAAALSTDNITRMKNARKRIWDTFELSDSKRDLVVRPCKVLPEAEKIILDKPMQQISKIMVEPRKGIAYIPGSSVKGAFRTAVLEYLRSQSDKQPPRGMKEKDFEAGLLGQAKFDVKDDIFKYIKFSDFRFVDDKSDTYIGKINNGTATPIYSAMTTAECFDKPKKNSDAVPYVVLTGSVSIDDRFWECKPFRDLNMKTGLMTAVINDYFAEACSQPNYKKIWKSDNGEKLNQKIADECDKNGWNLLRLGHYIGIQNYTFKVEQENPPRKSNNPSIASAQKAIGLMVEQENPPRKSNNPRINMEGGKTLCTIEDINLPPGFCLFKLTEDRAV